jgi:hypothetical protein
MLEIYFAVLFIFGLGFLRVRTGFWNNTWKSFLGDV